MRVGDPAAGVFLVLFGVGTAAYASTFPAMPGQHIGPGVFPGVIGIGLAALGAALVASGWRRPHGHSPAPDPEERRPPRSPRFALVIGALLFYVVAVDWLGFLPAAFLFLSGLMLAFEVRRSWIAPAAALTAFAIHYAFYSLLRVPLPWGILQPLAW